MQIIIFFLILSAFVGPYVFIFTPKIHLIRFVTPLFLACNLKTSLRFTYPLKITFIYFSIYLIYTLLISIFYYDNIELFDVFNFILLHGYILSLIIAVLAFPIPFFSAIKLALYCFIAGSLLLAIHEEVNLEHLQYSSMASEPEVWPERHMPTTFFTNPNDFAAAYLMSTMLLLTISLRTSAKWLRFWAHGFLISSCLWVIFVTDAKLNLIAFSAFLFVYFRLWRVTRLFQIAFVALIFLIYFIKPLTNYLTRQKTELFTYQIVSGGSISERLKMIEFGFRSIVDGYSLGFGVNAASDYYHRYVGNGLTGHVTDPHNYLIELLINSGLWILLLYLLLNVFLFVYLVKQRSSKLLIVQFLLYNFILLSSSSSIFWWPHYLFFIAYISYKKTSDAQH